MKILTVVGARPQFIKAYPFSYYAEREADLQEVLVHTGQHYDYEMSQLFFEELQIPKPDYHLGVGSGLHGVQTGKMLHEIEEVILIEKPDLVLVYGDTNSTLAGSLSAVKMHIPVAHVEAGLRSFRRDMPEEINRIMTDHISSLLFCPTEEAVKNLQKEGINRTIKEVLPVSITLDDQFVIQLPDIMQEAIVMALPLAEKKESILSEYSLKEGKYYLATMHRPENVDNIERITAFAEILSEISHKHPVFFPIHPRTAKQWQKFKLPRPSNVHFSKPVGYLSMISLQKQAKAILTDSGGIQKEACWLGTTCLTMRNTTEWVETLEQGNHLVDLDKDKIFTILNQIEEKTHIKIALEHVNPSKEIGRLLQSLYFSK